MKIAIIVESSKGDFDELINVVVENKNQLQLNPFFIDTEHCDENHEYNFLLDNIKLLSQSDNDIMLARFSGRESIIKNLGDECSEMIFNLSYNKNSKYYVEQPTDVFLDLLTIFKRGD